MSRDDDDKKRVRGTIVGGEDKAPPTPVVPVAIGVLAALAMAVFALWILNRGDDPVATPNTTATTTTEGPTTTAPPDTTTSPTTLASTTTTTSATTTTSSAWDDGDTDPKTADGEPFNEYGLLTDVRFAQREEGFTRVVFDFEDDDVVPWWNVEYRPGPFFSTDGSEVAVGGTHFLSVVFAGSGVDLSGAEFRITYEGPDRIATSTNSVVEIVLVEDFEGVSQWVIGVTGEKPFFVGELTDHARIYIDIAD